MVLSLSSSDAGVASSVRLNCYSNPTDLANCVRGMKKIGEWLRTSALKPYKVQNLPGVEGFKYLGKPLPNNQTDNTAFERFCLESKGSHWHYHGGSLVGKVLDGSFRVKGIKALRVVDASPFSTTSASHPQGFYLMLGRFVIRTCNH
ncbi:unnamed protein product [Prunus armeniaca]